MHFEVIVALAESTPSDNGTDWTLILSLVATGLALMSVGWNIYNAISERKAKRRPDVHASVVVDAADPNSALAFINAGPGMARNPCSCFSRMATSAKVGSGPLSVPLRHTKSLTWASDQPNGEVPSCGATWT
jgi:hypothetical protein